MTLTSPTGARPRRGRPRHQDSPRARSRARRDAPATEQGASRVAGVATQLTTVVEVDLTDVPADRVLAVVAAGAVHTIGDHPTVLGRVDPETGVLSRPSAVHLAVLAEDGTPDVVVEDADDLTAAALARRLAEGHGSAQQGTLGVVDTGSLGALVDTPLVGRDRSTVLGIGAPVRRPVVVALDGGEVIAVRAMAHLSLSYDPRVLGTADAARFMSSVRHAVEGDLA
ncbi:2-oxo acid dehydrogenase subunit E2 [Nocardioides sp. Soil805]|uniref:2-oxo acid dehydrogenase subunit E2 n=1 Tax=Nocardioides sp. Soil805 TaxID=1736416 RepID=UPI000703A838|nr:2-oxo acid dehydrogenase subunit E2 [Nocardioides sp. Soil805]KRF37262.1 hypothetical protein ASG94_07950 [Nocardioides sp. Soil805]